MIEQTYVVHTQQRRQHARSPIVFQRRLRAAARVIVREDHAARLDGYERFGYFHRRYADAVDLIVGDGLDEHQTAGSVQQQHFHFFRVAVLEQFADDLFHVVQPHDLRLFPHNAALTAERLADDGKTARGGRSDAAHGAKLFFGCAEHAVQIAESA